MAVLWRTNEPLGDSGANDADGASLSPFALLPGDRGDSPLKVLRSLLEARENEDGLVMTELSSAGPFSAQSVETVLCWILAVAFVLPDSRFRDDSATISR